MGRKLTGAEALSSGLISQLTYAETAEVFLQQASLEPGRLTVQLAFAAANLMWFDLHSRFKRVGMYSRGSEQTDERRYVGEFLFLKNLRRSRPRLFFACAFRSRKVKNDVERTVVDIFMAPESASTFKRIMWRNRRPMLLRVLEEEMVDLGR